VILANTSTKRSNLPAGDSPLAELGSHGALLQQTSAITGSSIDPDGSEYKSTTLLSST